MKMASLIANIATSAAKTAHAHVAALLAARQVQPGDKLPLNETVKETDATTPIKLAPTGQNIFVRVASSSRPHTVSFSPSSTSPFSLKRKLGCICILTTTHPNFFRRSHENIRTHIHKYIQT